MPQRFVALESQNSPASAMQALIAAFMQGQIGVVTGLANTLAVSERGAGANASVDVATGGCYVGAGTNNVFFYSSSVENLTISANSSGNDRIDTVVVELDLSQSPGSDTCQLVVVEGTPAGSPAAPTLTQTATLYQFPLADVAVADGFSSISDANITDRRAYARNDDQQPTTVRGTSGDETRTTTTLSNHGDFTFTAAANSRYLVELELLFTSPVAADLKATFTGPSGATWEGFGQSEESGTEQYLVFTEASSFLFFTDNADQKAIITLMLTVSSTAGAFTFQWAQNAASGTSTLYGDESFMRYQLID